jgi:hypothetical protein
MLFDLLRLVGKGGVQGRDSLLQFMGFLFRRDPLVAAVGELRRGFGGERNAEGLDDPLKFILGFGQRSFAFVLMG